ncbi:MAG: hypothetical protein IPP88_18685 [Betaproteobacteria bacterium]|nr:hypothetical protein [Betaproteobacteria bacterium]
MVQSLKVAGGCPFRDKAANDRLTHVAATDKQNFQDLAQKLHCRPAQWWPPPLSPHHNRRDMPIGRVDGEFVPIHRVKQLMHDTKFASFIAVSSGVFPIIVISPRNLRRQTGDLAGKRQRAGGPTPLFGGFR